MDDSQSAATPEPADKPVEQADPAPSDVGADVPSQDTGGGEHPPHIEPSDGQPPVEGTGPGAEFQPPAAPQNAGDLHASPEKTTNPLSGGFDQARDEVIAGGSDRVTALSKEPEGVLAHPVVNQLAVLRRRQEVRGTIGPDDWARAWAALQLPPWDKLRDHVDPGVSA